MKHAWDTHPRIDLHRLDTDETETILEDAADARYVATGHLVFLRRGMRMAVGFDPARMKENVDTHCSSFLFVISGCPKFHDTTTEKLSDLTSVLCYRLTSAQFISVSQRIDPFLRRQSKHRVHRPAVACAHCTLLPCLPKLRSIPEHNQPWRCI